FDSWAAFEQVLDTHRARVAAEFRAVVAAPDDDTHKAIDGLEPWIGLWDGSIQDEEALAFLESKSCDDPQRVLQLIQQSRESRAIINMQASSRTRLDAFIPRLLLMLSKQ